MLKNPSPQSPDRSKFPTICLVALRSALMSDACLRCAYKNDLVMCIMWVDRARVCRADVGNIWKHLRAGEGCNPCPAHLGPPSSNPLLCLRSSAYTMHGRRWDKYANPSHVRDEGPPETTFRLIKSRLGLGPLCPVAHLSAALWAVEIALEK